MNGYYAPVCWNCRKAVQITNQFYSPCLPYLNKEQCIFKPRKNVQFIEDENYGCGLVDCEHPTIPCSQCIEAYKDC